MKNLASQRKNVGCKPLTTFVQTDTNSFREVVQRLTGFSDATEGTTPIITQKFSRTKRPTSKLHERRQYTRPKLEIVKPSCNFKSLMISPRVLSPNNEEEEKAIKERRFYLHPSPRSKPDYAEPQLLNLFPLISPRDDDYS
ncbi:hypothetical protein Tsubulata_018918 [Turnera subulata]|uniref:VQ domain-containing protein n=1 Tax=Turnera subulata TaxID=218843 RepID=A0A9Q0FWU4_9ROSI|nr:hypothetical protein Tsubulata_018918 [Turnera subulata]